MKIYKLVVKSIFQPHEMKAQYPPGNGDYGVEQDFENFLNEHVELSIDNPGEADWHYLPIFWTRWHVMHDYAATGANQLQREVDRVMIDDRKTFTICQYDDGPVVNVGKTIQFLASRKVKKGVDIPLLRNSVRRKRWIKPRKKYLASFSGRLQNHQVRKLMAKSLKGIKEILVVDQVLSQKEFVDTLERSYVALCPRGYGGSSFRFYEAMELGIVPFLISDLDTRPFKTHINWDSCSFYIKNVNEVENIINKYDKKTLLKMGKQAKLVYEEYLRFGKWSRLVIKTLENI